MRVEDLLKELNITGDVEYKDKDTIVRFADSDEYARTYTKLDKSDLVELDTEAMMMTMALSYMKYFNDEFPI